MIYDIAIIGGGPAGYTAAERAGSEGLKVILFEKKALGGVCLNEGCMPTKTLLHSAKMYDSLANATKYGVSVGEVGFDLGRIIGRKQKIVRKLIAGVRQKLAAHDVVAIMGEARMSGEDANKNIEVSCGEEKYLAKKVLLCAGSEAIIPPIKGLDSSGYWTSKEALDNKEVPKSIVVIGGGVIGTEFASFFNSLGVKVTVVEMLPEILGAMDKKISVMLREELTKNGIVFHLETKVLEVKDNQVVVEKAGEQFVIDGEQVLLSTGRKPIVEGLGTDLFKLEMHGRGLKVSSTMQTSDSRVYACGDITGQSLLAHTAIREAEVAINTILGKNDSMSYKAIPSVVYTYPEISGVGRTEEDLEVEGEKYTVHQLPMAFAGRFVVENEQGNGVCKLLTDENSIVVGCHILGNPSSELIVIAGIAVERGFTLDEFRRIIFPHPTVGEILHEVLFI